MPKPIRPIRFAGDIAYVPLTQGYEAVIDAADVPLVQGRFWCAHVRRKPDGSVRAVYAITNFQRDDGSWAMLLLHRSITGAPDALDIDHVDGDGINNRRLNLRVATHAENQHNRRLNANNASGHKGVSWASAKTKWRAEIMANGKTRFLGLFETSEAASDAYAKASAELHGKFGRVA